MVLFGLPNQVWDNANNWFDYWLKGIDTGVMDEDPVNMRIKNSGDWFGLEGWPTQATQDQTYYLSKRGLFSNGGLDETPRSSWRTNDIFTGILSGATTGVPIISPLFEAHTDLEIITWVPAINRLIAIVYEN